MAGKGSGGAAVTLAGRATELSLFRRAGRKAQEAVRRAMAGLPASVSAPGLPPRLGGAEDRALRFGVEVGEQNS